MKKTNAKYETAWYPTPIDLPEASSGKAQIRHRTIQAGEKVTIVGIRQAYLRGIQPTKGLLSGPLLVHELVHEDHGMWMTDLPEELNQIAELLYNVEPAGSVLVGGLGLGILPTEVARRIEVSDVTVVELDKHIIKLCANGVGFDVVEDDIADYLRTTPETFDFYLLDTWQSTSEDTWWSEVMPLRRIIRQRWGTRPVVHCWAEDIMQAQLFQSLTTKPPHWYYENLPMPMPEKEARSFLRNVGWPSWERRYGEAIDKTMAHYQELYK